MWLDNLHQKRSGAPIAMATWNHDETAEGTCDAVRRDRDRLRAGGRVATGEPTSTSARLASGREADGCGHRSRPTPQTGCRFGGEAARGQGPTGFSNCDSDRDATQGSHQGRQYLARRLDPDGTQESWLAGEDASTAPRITIARETDRRVLRQSALEENGNSRRAAARSDA